MSYCSAQDVIDRLSETGAMYCVNDDEDSSLDASESSLIDDSIEAVATEIDAALTPWVNTPRSHAGNSWLLHRCVDLAAARVVSRKGQGVPESLREEAERSRAWLDMVRTGQLRVPALTYPTDVNDLEQRRMGLPLAANPRS